ncbi:PAS domain S-box protein [Chitinophagaceae bacterium MMS25-I14]
MPDKQNHIENARVIFWDWEPGKYETLFTPELQQWLGYGHIPAEVITNTLLHPEDRDTFLGKLTEYIKNAPAAPFVKEVRLLHKDGTSVSVLGVGRVVKTGENNDLLQVSGSFTELTAVRETEQVLTRRMELLDKTNQIALVGGWEVDLTERKITWTTVTRAIHEVDYERNPTFDEAIAFFKEGPGRDKLVHAFQDTAETSKPFDLELELITAKGKEIWTRVTGHASSDHGNCTSIYGSIQDITEKKSAEERLNVIFEESTDAHLLFDETGIIDCNNAAVKMLRCRDKNELLSSHPARFSPIYQPDGRRSDEKSIEMDRTAYEKGVNNFEWTHTRLNGEEFPVEVTLNPVKINNKPVLLVVWHDITERKNAENRLRESEARLNETQELTHSGSWELNLVTGENRWSAEAFRIFGLEPAETGPSTELFSSMIHPEDYGKYIDAIRKAIHNGESSDFDLRIVLQDKTVKHIHAIGKPCYNDKGHVVRLEGAIVDITARKASEAAIQLKEEQLRTFIEYTPVAIAMLDRNMRYIAASNVWKTSYRLGDQNIIGKSHYEVFPEIREEWKEQHQRCLAGEVLRSEEDFFVRQDGHTDWLRWEIRPWYENEHHIGGIVMFTEVITGQIEAREALIKAKEQAEQAAIAKSQFLSTMSHEIRTPLNAVIGFTHLLLQNPREDQKEYLEILKFSGENLLVLINDILDFNKIEAGKIDFEETQFGIRDLLNNIKLASLQKATEKGILLKLMVDEDVPHTVKGDPVRIGQILTNLVSNAVKFTTKGKVTISASLVQKDAETATINFEVRDTGIGIPKEKHQTIFDSFTQASADTTRKYGGTGLGLTITKRLLELYGSAIHLESVPGEGSAFSFNLKLKRTSDQSSDNVKHLLHANDKDLKGMRLLLAEDNPINVLLARQFLNQWNIISDIAENGAVAVRMVQENDYDIVLMDLQMPEMDGYEATLTIRNLPGEKFSTLPIIALTASAMLDIKDKAFTVGMNDYVSKPFNPDELYKKLLHFGRNKMHRR